MIGHMRFQRMTIASGEVERVEHVAELSEDGSWRITPDPGDDRIGIEATLTDIVRDYGGPSDGPFGPRQLREAAEQLSGTYHVSPKDEPPPGTVY